MRRWVAIASAVLAVGFTLRAAAVVDPQWTIADVKRGATEIAAVIERRLDYATTYRFARGVLEKSVQSGKDTRGFRLGAELAITHWLARLPPDTSWRPKALARHRDVTHWIAKESPLPLRDVAHVVAVGVGIASDEEGWLLGVLQGEPGMPLGRHATPGAAQ